MFRFSDIQRHYSAVVHRCVFYMDPVCVRSDSECIISVSEVWCVAVCCR